jgi:hypothetical protein
MAPKAVNPSESSHSDIAAKLSLDRLYTRGSDAFALWEERLQG